MADNWWDKLSGNNILPGAPTGPGAGGPGVAVAGAGGAGAYDLFGGGLDGFKKSLDEAFFGKTTTPDPTVLNPQDAQSHADSLALLKALQGQYGDINGQLTSEGMRKMLADMQATSGQYDAVGAGITNAAGQFNNIDAASIYANMLGSFNPLAGNDALLGSMNGYADAAGNAAARSLGSTTDASGMSSYRDAATKLADLTSKNALSSTANQLASSGLLNSGAANQSMLEASYTPQAQLTTDLAKMQSDSYNSILGNLMNNGSSLIGSGYSMQNQNNQQSAAAQLQNKQLGAQAGLSAAQSLTDVLNGKSSAQQGAYNSQLQNILAQLQSLSGQGTLANALAGNTGAQYYAKPGEKTSGIADYLSLLLGSGKTAASLAALA